MTNSFETMVHWHKAMIGAPFDGASDAANVTVAMIDTGVHPGHPALKDVVLTDKAVNLASSASGLSVMPMSGKLPFDAKILNGLDLSDAHRDLIADVVTDVVDSLKKWHATPLPSGLNMQDYSRHGTACAGLIAAKPVAGKAPANATLNDFLDHCYSGIAPGAKIIPINTSMNPKEEPLILALLYSLHYKADIIHLPRGVNDRWINESASGLPANPENTKRYYDTLKEWQRRKDLGHALQALLVAVSKKIPIFCAAGNSGEYRVAYPANLSRADNGIISIGAVTRKGFRSGYSNYGENLDLVAPSDDAEVFTRHQIRLNPLDPSYKRHDYAAYGDSIPTIPYSTHRIVTTDIPDRPGYVGLTKLSTDDTDPFRNWIDQLGGDFTLFGGTSAASAIAAGVGALAVSVAKKAGMDCSGVSVKRMLKDTCVKDFASTEGTGKVSLAADQMEEGKPPVFEYLFGAGLIHAGRAVALVTP
jgi:subtilisin family serine protease